MGGLSFRSFPNRLHHTIMLATVAKVAPGPEWSKRGAVGAAEFRFTRILSYKVLEKWESIAAVAFWKGYRLTIIAFTDDGLAVGYADVDWQRALRELKPLLEQAGLKCSFNGPGHIEVTVPVSDLTDLQETETRDDFVEYKKRGWR
ncbi:hypothetical protein AC20117_02060 [Arthrobacter crystallopoietes]|nr:hypothetical protein AC20117_02060 [Arthrobacter crystallopoietes]